MPKITEDNAKAFIHALNVSNENQHNGIYLVTWKLDKTPYDCFRTAEEREKNLNSKDIGRLARECFDFICKDQDQCRLLKRGLEQYVTRVKQSIEGRWWWCIARFFGCTINMPEEIQETLTLLTLPVVASIPAPLPSIDPKKLADIQHRYDNWKEEDEKEIKERAAEPEDVDALAKKYNLNFWINASLPLPSKKEQLLVYREVFDLIKICQKIGLALPTSESLSKVEKMAEIDFEQVSPLHTELKDLITQAIRDNKIEKKYTFRDLEVLPEVLNLLTPIEELTVYNVRTIPALTLPHLKHLRVVHGRGFKQLPDLSGCPHLETVSFAGSEVEFFPRNQVLPPSVKFLNLYQTPLRQLPKWIDKLENLVTLDVSATSISEFPKGFFQLKNLTHLNVSSNPSFKTLPDYLLLMPNLTKVDATYNEHLQKMSIETSNLHVSYSDYSNVVNLQQLPVAPTSASLQPTAMPIPAPFQTAFPPLSNREHEEDVKEQDANEDYAKAAEKYRLELDPYISQKNQVKNYRETFALIKICQALKLDLASAEQNTSIKKMYKSGTEAIAHAEVFEVRKYLKEALKTSKETFLQIKNTEIEAVPEEINSLGDLTTIWIEPCPNLVHIPALNLPNLTRIYIRGAKSLRHFPDLSQCTKLESVDFASSGIEELPEKVVLPPTVTTLKLISSPLKCLPHWIGNLKRLNTLYIQETSVTTFPPSFYRNLKNLEIYLFRMKSPLSVLSKDFIHMYNVIILVSKGTTLPLSDEDRASRKITLNYF